MWSFMSIVGNLTPLITPTTLSMSRDTNSSLSSDLTDLSIDTDSFSAFVVAFNTLRGNKISLDKESGSVSLLLCSRCNTRSMVVEMAQLRSADEESTEVHRCFECDR